MINFIKALYADLLQRIVIVINEIENNKYHDDIKDNFIKETLNQFLILKEELQAAFDSGELEFDDFRSNNIIKYNNTHSKFKAIHSYRYLVIKNYSDPEIFFYQVITKIYKEHRITANPPIISTISNHNYYYWAVPYFEIIALPTGEENSLLNLPDLYHEIGHLLHRMFNGKSCEMSGKAVDKYFKKKKFKTYFPNLFSIKSYWQNAWLEEFTCDLIGTYMTGVAYAWTNLKLISVGHGSTKIYEYYESHPSDEARMRIILMMLEKLGLEKEKETIDGVWSSFLEDSQMYRPDHYEFLYPDEILKQMVEEFFDFYQNADLASYPELYNSQESPIAQILNEAWTMAKSDPTQFFSYESNRIKALKMELLNKPIA